MQSKATDGSDFTEETADSEAISSAKDSSANKVFPQPSSPLYLSSRGLTIALVFMILTPVCLVAAAVTMFPAPDQRELPVSILLDGYHYPAEVQASVDAFNGGKGQVLEPFLTVRNDGEETLSSLFVTINKRFVFHASEPLAPGDTQDFYLSRLQEPDGSMFWPNHYDVRRVIVKARLPSKKQAIFQADWASLVTRNAANSNSGEPVDESVESTLGSNSDTGL